MRLSPSALKTFGYELQFRADEHDGQTVPPFDRVAAILGWLGTYPRMPEAMTPSATWEENNVRYEMTARLGPRGGISSPEQHQGIQLRIEEGETVHTAELRVDRAIHTTAVGGREIATWYDQDALGQLYDHLGSTVVNLVLGEQPGYQSSGEYQKHGRGHFSMV
jgi:hypothetical protein